MSFFKKSSRGSRGGAAHVRDVSWATAIAAIFFGPRQVRISSISTIV